MGGGKKKARGYGLLLLHLFTLWSFAVAQPVYDLLGRSPDFVVARRLDLWELGLLVIILSGLLPSILCVVILALFCCSRSLGRLAHGILFISLLTVAVMAALKKISFLEDGWMLLLALALGTAASGFYFRFGAVKSFFSFLSPSILIFPLALLFYSPASATFRSPGLLPTTPVAMEKSNLPPVVMVVFDELPLATLLDSEGRIDAKRFPNFASLAGDATWYRDATTVAESTHKALPALLSGLYPTSQKLATYLDYPNTLFSLLEPTHEMRVFESITQLCPPDLCPEILREPVSTRLSLLLGDLTAVYGHLVLPKGLTTGLPDVGNNWQSFRRTEWQLERSLFFYRESVIGFNRFLETFDSAANPRFYFYHAAFPHYPWMYLPSGKGYTPESLPQLFFNDGVWTASEPVVRHAFQRYLLQLGYTDRLLGSLIRRLRETGLYDRALILILSDHGMSFKPGGYRRKLNDANVAEIMSVPLFARFPGQDHGATLEANAELVDVLPTIADYLGVPVTWQMDGVSLRSGKVARSHKVIFTQSPGPPLTTDLKLELSGKFGACLAGRIHRLSSDGLAGSLEFEKGDQRIEFWGAAGDEKTEQPADGVLVFLNGQLLQREPLDEGRPDVARFFANPGMHDTGFRLSLSTSLIDREGNQRLQFFALKGDEIAELKYPPGYPWQESRPATPLVYPWGCEPEAEADRLVLYAASDFPGQPGPSEFSDKMIKQGLQAGPDLLLPPASFADLLGRGVGELPSEDSNFLVEIERAELYESVDPESGFVPTEVAGKFLSQEPFPPGAQIAIALNGVVVAVVSPFEPVRDEKSFLAILPEQSFVKGANQLEFYLVWTSDDRTRLASLTLVP